eukprot:COSAG01_NODE_35409_length_532_cov_1.073903_2_plen_49_part_01
MTLFSLILIGELSSHEARKSASDQAERVPVWGPWLAGMECWLVVGSQGS